MAINVTLNELTTGYNFVKINENFTNLKSALLESVSRTGSSPNTMSADLDMNNHNIINLKSFSLEGGKTLQELVDEANTAATTAEIQATTATTQAGIATTKASEAAASAASIPLATSAGSGKGIISDGTNWGYTDTLVADNGITESKILNGAVTTSKLSTSGVTAGSYTNTNLTVGVDGRITSASNGTTTEVKNLASQTIMSGHSTNYTSDFLTTGSGLVPGILATDTPLVLSFSNGANEYRGTISGDTVTLIPAVEPNVTSFIAIDRVEDGTLSGYRTKVFPLESGTYGEICQAKFDLNNTILDDFGAHSTNTSMTFNNASPAIAGTHYGVFNGSASLVCPNMTHTYVDSSGWALRGWCKFTSLAPYTPTFSLENASSYGARIHVNTSGKLFIYLSSTGSSHDICNATVGTTTIATGTWHFVELTWDRVSNHYYLYLDGTLEISVASSSELCDFYSLYMGYSPGGASYLTGQLQGIEFLPYCDHPAGTSYSVPTALSNIATPGYCADWFDILNRQMKTPSAPSTAAGSPPTFTVKNRVYIGEVTSNASAIVAAFSYTPRGVYVGPWSDDLAVSTNYSANHWLGSNCLEGEFQIKLKKGYDSTSAYYNGWMVSPLVSNGTYCYPQYCRVTRNNIQTHTSSTAPAVVNMSSGAAVGTTPSQWLRRFIARRKY